MNLFGIIAAAVLPYVAVSCSPESRCALLFNGVLGQVGFVISHLYEMVGGHCSGQAGIAQIGWSMESKFMVSNANLGEMQISPTLVFLFPSSVLNGNKFSVDFSPRCSPGASIFPFDTKQNMETALSLGRSTQIQSALRGSVV